MIASQIQEDCSTVDRFCMVMELGGCTSELQISLPPCLRDHSPSSREKNAVPLWINANRSGLLELTIVQLPWR